MERPPILRTERLEGEPVTEAHAERLFEQLWGDPRVMATLGGATRTLDDVRRSAEGFAEHWRRHGFGTWVFARRDGGGFVGLGGLGRYETAEGTVPGLIYHVAFDAWGRGFATEIARATLRFAFEVLGRDAVYSWTLPENLASQRVMEKCGMERYREGTFKGRPHVFFRLQRPGRGRRRPAGRVILLDPEDRILLLRAVLERGLELWLTPGGGCEEGEAPAEAARRELREETGIEAALLGPPVWHRTHSFTWKEELLDVEEWFFLHRLHRAAEVPEQTLDPVEREWIRELRWWTPEEVRGAAATVFAPRRLADLLPPIVAGAIPASPLETGV